MLNHALSEGVAEQELLTVSKYHDSLNDIQAVPAEDFFELHEQLDVLLGPGFSVRVGQAMKIEDYGVLGLSWRTCSQAKEIFERSERYFKLLSNTYLFKVNSGPEVSDILLYRDAHRRGLELSNEATLSAAVVMLRAMTETEISPLSVSFKHHAPSNLSDYTAAFRCPIHFNQTENTLTYRTVDLNMRTAKADVSINKFLVERVEEATAGIEVSGNRIVADIEQLIRDALPSGIPSIGKVSKHIGMSSRTLTRRLAESGIPFRELIHKTQESMARNLLLNTSRSMAEIAFQTGFSEQSAFSRAFKRWTGQSPAEYRKIG